MRDPIEHNNTQHLFRTKETVRLRAERLFMDKLPLHVDLNDCETKKSTPQTH